MEEILALAKKVAEETEVYMVSSEETPVQFESNRLKNTQYKQSQSVALRVIKNGKTGYATSTNMENAQQLVDDAVATAGFGMKAEFQFPAVKTFPRIATFDAEVEKVSLEKMIQLGEELISKVIKRNQEAIKIFYKKYSPCLSHYIQLKIEKREDAEEILQETFISLIDSLPLFSYRCLFTTWAISPARHEVAEAEAH